MICKKIPTNKREDKMPQYSKEFLLKMYSEMLLIRRFEERSGQLYGMGHIGGFCHLYIGQEAVSSGIAACLEKDDAVITSYRDHGQMLSAGSDPKVIMAELLGRATGCSKGKGGSMHMFDVEKKFYGGHGIVAAQVPIGTGIAFAFKQRAQKNVCIVYLGDGASNQGQVFEAFNMAKLWGLPVIYVIENNKYAMGTSVERSAAVQELYTRGQSNGIEGVQIDGMNFLTVYEEAKKVIDKVRNESTPMIIEMLTYRYRGHSMSDPAKYRTKEEVDDYKNRFDPILSLAAVLQKNHKVKEEELEAIDEKIIKQVRDAADFALNSPLPKDTELYTDIYS